MVVSLSSKLFLASRPCFPCSVNSFLNYLTGALATKQQTYGQFTYVIRIVYTVVAWLFISGLFLQFFLVGLSIFVGPSWWGTHVAFGRGFAVITPVLLLLALAGRFPRGQVVLTAILIPLYVWQILLIELPGRFGVIVLSALHPVNAGLMLAIAVILAHRAWKATHAKAEMKDVSQVQSKETRDAVITLTAPRATTSMHNHS